MASSIYECGSVRGYETADGYLVAYDYASGQWIDERPDCERDRSYLPGMASNPLAHRRPMEDERDRPQLH